jgi:hypothetical protein
VWQFAPSHHATPSADVMFPTTASARPRQAMSCQPQRVDRRTIMPLAAPAAQPSRQLPGASYARIWPPDLAPGYCGVGQIP